MGDKSTAIVVINNKSQIEKYNGQKKKRQRFSFFKTAMVLLRSSNRSNKKIEATKIINVTKSDNNSDDNWKKIVGSMRPLHLQDSQSLLPQNLAAAKAVYATTPSPSEDGYFSVSPAPSTSSWSTMSHYASTNSLQELAGFGKHCESPYNNRRLSDNMSRYASALNLHDLDVAEQIEEDVEEEENDDNVLENYAADNMIDSKADEFIAKFYDQMRNQMMTRV